MGDEPNKPAPRTLTEDEAYAIVADRVKRETAELTAKNESAEREIAELRGKLDVAEAGLATEKAAREKAERDLEEHKNQVEAEKAALARTSEREAKVREIAAALKDDFYTDERKRRWAAMDDAAFQTYCDDLKATVGVAGAASGAVPRETAMKGDPVTPAPDTGNADRLFALTRGGAPSGE